MAQCDLLYCLNWLKKIVDTSISFIESITFDCGIKSDYTLLQGIDKAANDIVKNMQ